MNSYLIVRGSDADHVNTITEIASQKDPDFSFSQTDPDICIVDPVDESSIGIDKVREITHFFSTRPFSGKVKTVFIKDSGKLTIEAQNALLKTLEEPPSYGLIFLAVLKEDKVLETIVSRCSIKTFPIQKEKIDPELKETYLTLCKQIKDSSIGISFKNFESHTQDSSKAKEFLNAMVLSLREDLLKSENREISPNLSTIYLRQFEKAYKSINSNANLRLTIDSLVVTLKELTR
jgi:hypothetical protein